MKFAQFTLLTTVTLLGALPIPVRLAAQNAGSQIITFDAPDAGKAERSGQGTFPDSISEAGAVAGHYVDANKVTHGFLRSPGGTEFTAFDAPGAGRVGGSGQGTFPKSINKAGAVTGHYVDSNNVAHGFLRSPGSNALITFDAPGAGRTASAGQGTFPDSISDVGAVTGHYVDSYNVTHGFLRAAGGELLAFDAAGAGNTAGEGTFPDTFNRAAGSVAGHYIDSYNVNHAFVRVP
jgi:hypothetical protein